MTFSWTCMLLLLLLKFSLRANDLPTQTCRVLTSVFPKCVVQHFVVHFYQSGFSTLDVIILVWIFLMLLEYLFKNAFLGNSGDFIYFKIGLGFVSRSLQNFIINACLKLWCHHFTTRSHFKLSQNAL